ncbi:MAG: Putative glycerate kinase [Anaerolinea thermophila]|uniref:Putative glycerate kinase n=1 Tax=Anaerolinea thermophila TaxID=167964 RepID=A0A101FYS4_9CHLR|nr:MAG: Putative glycerate kinase [Anaerolinea thermophila]
MTTTPMFHFQCASIEQSDIKADIQRILESAFTRVDPIHAVQNAIRRSQNYVFMESGKFIISPRQKIHILGLGKAAQPMAVGVKQTLQGMSFNGAVITKHNSKILEKTLLPEIQTFEGDHPIPTERSRNGVQLSLAVLGKMNPTDVVICLISGGGSSLAILPREGVSIAAYQEVTRLLLECGASIQEINVIRQKLDRFKGGGLVDLLFPASVITLILSDVVGDPLDIIASGPTVLPQKNTITVELILKKYGLTEKIPSSVRKCLLEEQYPKEPLKELRGTTKNRVIENILIGNNTIAAQAACTAAKELGYDTRIINTKLQGEASEIGWELGSFLKNKVKKEKQCNKKRCWIFGGETTVTIHGNGKGGRNQELALSAARSIAGIENVGVLSIATDGEDGPTDAAGAFVTGDTVRRGKQAGMEIESYLKNNDAYPYLEKVGGLIKTGPSGTNVNDLVFLFAY